MNRLLWTGYFELNYYELSVILNLVISNLVIMNSRLLWTWLLRTRLLWALGFYELGYFKLGYYELGYYELPLIMNLVIYLNLIIMNSRVLWTWLFQSRLLRSPSDRFCWSDSVCYNQAWQYYSTIKRLP